MTEHVKYPRTNHLPWSPGAGLDDRRMADTNELLRAEVVITEKMDGECTTLYRDGMHARSLDGRRHPSQDWVRGFHGRIAHEIPEGMRICGENVYARHSIPYTGLPSYFLGFSAWIGNACLRWSVTRSWFDYLGITPVPVIVEPIKLTEMDLRKITGEIRTGQEGFVVRPAAGFNISEFSTRVGKYVRANHVPTNDHWATGPVLVNALSQQVG